jgi:hypothetical protein
MNYSGARIINLARKKRVIKAMAALVFALSQTFNGTSDAEFSQTHLKRAILSAF